MESHEEKLARDFTRSGAIVAAIYNVNRKPGARILGPADIFPVLNKYRGRPREATVGELHAMFQGIIANFRNTDGQPQTPVE